VSLTLDQVQRWDAAAMAADAENVRRDASSAAKQEIDIRVELEHLPGMWRGGQSQPKVAAQLTVSHQQLRLAIIRLHTAADAMGLFAAAIRAAQQRITAALNRAADNALTVTPDGTVEAPWREPVVTGLDAIGGIGPALARHWSRMCLARELSCDLKSALATVEAADRHAAARLADMADLTRSGFSSADLQRASSSPRAAEAITAIRSLSTQPWWGTTLSGGERDDWVSQVRSLTPAEANAVIAGLTDEELTQWNRRIAALGNPERVAVANALLGGANRAQLRRLQGLSALAPTPLPGQSYPLDYPGGTDAALPVTDGVNWGDGSQGKIGDCGLIASLKAIEKTSPGFVLDHLKANDNGTYTVTLYDHGKPVPVVVDNRLPQDDEGIVNVAGDYREANIGGRSETWLSLYEKAAAQRVTGGYPTLELGFSRLPVINEFRGRFDIDMLTGKATEMYSTSLSASGNTETFIRDHQLQGQAVIGSTWSASPDLPLSDFETQAITDQHAYTVLGVRDNGVLRVSDPKSPGEETSVGDLPTSDPRTFDRLTFNQGTTESSDTVNKYFSGFIAIPVQPGPDQQ
jgi:hypothetical protein